MDLGFLTPEAALIGLAGIVPLAVLALGRRRADRLRLLLGLERAGLVGRLEVPAAVCAVSGLLAVAAAQPVVRTERPRLARRDAQVFVAFDVSRSMLAAGSFEGPTRLERAKRIADSLRSRLADVPVGVASFTDRALPLLFPTASADAFAATVAEAVGIERPPPRDAAQTVPSLDALAPVPKEGFFPTTIAHRVLVLLTDGESNQLDADGLRQSFAARPRIEVVVIRVGAPGERVYDPDGLPEPAYVRPPESSVVLAQFLSATRGRLFRERDVSGAARAIRASLGSGPTTHLGTVAERRRLAPYLVLAAILPLGLVLRRRNI